MTHDEAGSDLSALIDGALAAPRKEAVEAHLAGCGECRQRLAELKSSIALFRAHGRREAPAALKTRVLVRAQEPEPAAAGILLAWKPVVTWSFVAAGVLFVSVSVLRQETQGPSEPQGMVQGFTDASEGPQESAPSSAAEAEKAPVQAKMMRKAGSRAAAQGFRRPAQAVELEGIGASALAGGGGSSAAYSSDEIRAHAEAPAAPVSGPAARLLVFQDQASFEIYWRSKAVIPAPKVDFELSRVAVLADAPAGSVWTVLTTLDTPDGREVRILYRQGSAPMAAGPAAAMPSLPPVFRILPKSDKTITLQKSR